MKSARHQAILDLIEQHPIDRQEDLLAHLREEGFDVTQATVSRDIRELQLVKTATADGRYRYVPASASGKVTHSPSRFEMIFRESVLKVDYAGHMVLVKCFSGMANAACEVFDAKQWDNVVGTLSGDDTFFILMRSEDDAAAICKQLGISTSTAFNIIANAFVRNNGMPFPLTHNTPSAEISRGQMLADTDAVLSSFADDYKRMAE